MSLRSALSIGCLVLVLSACSSSPRSTGENSNANIGNLPGVLLDGNGNTNLNTGLFTNEDLNANQNSANENMNTGSSPKSSSLSAINADDLLVREVSFACQRFSSLSSKPYYESLVSEFEDVFRFSSTELRIGLQRLTDPTARQALLDDRRNLRESTDNILTTCVSKDETVVVALVKGESDGTGWKIVRYLTKPNLLEVAAREDLLQGNLWRYLPTTFGKRTGSVLELAASGTTDGNRETLTLRYDFIRNSIVSDQLCSTGGGREKVCRDYPY